MEETLTAHNFWRLYDSGILWKFVIEHEGSWDSKDIQQLQAKIISVASTNFSIVFYSPRNSTYKNLLLAREILLTYRSSETIVGLAKGIGTEEQKLIITNLGSINVDDIDSYTTIFVGNKETKLTKTKKMVTPLL